MTEREFAIDRTIATIFANPMRVPGTFRDDLRWQMERADPAQMQTIGDLLAELAREPFAQIRIPTMVVWGEADAMIPTEREHLLAAASCGVSYAGLPGVGHTCQIEAPDAFISAVAPFLDAALVPESGPTDAVVVAFLAPRRIRSFHFLRSTVFPWVTTMAIVD